MSTTVTRRWLVLAVALALAAIFPARPSAAAPDIVAAVQSVPADRDMMSSIDALLLRALVTTDRADLIREFAAGRASVQRDCARLDLELRAGHRRTAAGLLTQLSARPEFARDHIPSGVVSFIVGRNKGRGLTDVALAVKLYRRFPDPELWELRDVLTFISTTEGDQAAARLLAGLPYTEQVSMAVGRWRPGVRKRGHVESVARTFKAAGRADLAKVIRGQPVTPTRRPVGQRVTPRAVAAKDQGKAPAAPAEPGTAEGWLAKADAAVRRREAAAADAAFLRALAAARVPSKTEGRIMGPRPVRLTVLAQYREFLIRQGRVDEAVALLRKEIASYGLDSLSGRFALRTLCEWNHPVADAATRPDDELLRRALGESEQWGDEELVCLDRMAEKHEGYRVPEETPWSESTAGYATLARAEKLCEGAHPSRAAVVGRLWLYHGRPERAVPLLEQAASRSDDPEEAFRLRGDLLRAYLEAGRPADAEPLVAERVERYPEEAIRHFARLTVAWVKAGDTTKAMANWRKVVNIDATQLVHLPVWSMERGGTVMSPDAAPPRYPPGRPEAEFRSELERFYRDWQKADAESWVPPLALRLLDADLKTWTDTVDVN